MSLEPQLKLNVIENNRLIFGDAEMRLLEAIGRQGTLAEGAATLGLSYRVAWGKLRDLEASIGTPLVRRRVGGAGGGASRLTEAATALVEQYSRFREAVGAFALAEFEKHFGEGVSPVVAGSQTEQGELTGSHRQHAPLSPSTLTGERP